MSEKDYKQFDQSQFEFASSAKEGIHDEAFKTKATTFARDALKRFAKNKSSVVGAVIIGILLLGSFILPYATGHDIKTPHTDMALLTPKLFDAGTGWWDGTEQRSNIAWDNSIVNYDGSHGAPANTKMEAVVPGTLVINDVSYIDQYFAYAAGGYLRLTTDGFYPTQEEAEASNIFLSNFTEFKVTNSENLRFTAEFGNVNDIAGDKLAPKYRFRLEYMGITKSYLDLTGWLTEYPETLEVNVSQKLLDAGMFDASNCKIRLEFLPDTSTSHYSYVLLKTLTFTSDTTDEAKQELYKDLSITDANYTAGKKKASKPVDNRDYWQSTAYKNVYHAEKRIVSFTFDFYANVFGARDNFTVGESIMKEYINKGWCEFTNFNDVSTFKVINEEKCPVISVSSSEYSTKYEVYQFKTRTIYYKYLGYNEPPRFIFGTNANGYDLLTLAMSCLKTSLLIAIISSAVCLAIGLVWGSISGYFGGTVDLVMERITDIIAGVPWIVMMTLVILLLGNNAVTFAIALILTGWIGTASVTRTQFYRFKGREYVLASRTLGASDARLIFKHVLPNGLGTIVTRTVLMIPGCIFSEATISYLGLGLKGIDSFGVLLSENQIYLNSYPMLIVFPAIVISLLMISFNLFGNGLRDALNPTLKGGEQ